jgi:hypothetical protein
MFDVKCGTVSMQFGPLRGVVFGDDGRCLYYQQHREEIVGLSNDTRVKSQRPRRRCRQRHPQRRRLQPTPRPRLVEDSLVPNPGRDNTRLLQPTRAETSFLTGDLIVEEHPHRRDEHRHANQDSPISDSLHPLVQMAIIGLVCAGGT